MLSTREIALIILNIVFMGTFLTIFFFTYAHKVEQQVFTNQINYITNDLLSDINVVVPQDTRPLLTAYLNDVQPPNYSSLDAQVTASNEAIKSKVFKIMIPTVIVALLTTFFMAQKYGFSYKEIFVQSMLTICVVGLVEYTFLKHFGSQYYSADVNMVKRKLLLAMQNNR